MKRAVSILLAGIWVCGAAHAAIPLQVNYQGRVMVGGVPFNGNGLFRFTLAERATSRTLWCNDGSVVYPQSANTTPTLAVNLPVINGIFNVRLGDAVLPNMRAIPSTVFNSDRVVLRVWFNDQVNGNRRLAPDQPITSVAYAYHALMAETATTATSAQSSLRATTATKALDSNLLQGLSGGSYQRRITGVAGANQYIRTINADGSVAVAADRVGITGVTAGLGLTGGGTSGSVTLTPDTTYLQRRVAASATAGRFIRAINPDGSIVTGTTVSLAADASHAANADRSTTATMALNSRQLQGMAATAYQRRVTGSASGGQFIRGINADGSIVTAFDQTGWSLSGNVATSPSINFLGTIDPQPLEIRVNNQPALRIVPAPDSPNLIGGHLGNFVEFGAMGAVIAGGGYDGIPNRVTDAFGTVGGGKGNQAGDGDAFTTSAMFTTVGGGEGNVAGGYYATVGGGQSNNAAWGHTTIGGGMGNTAANALATVGGGDSNAAMGMWATVGGGDWNSATTESAVGGGGSNTASGVASFVGGGWINVASGSQSVVGGGYGNEAKGPSSTVGGGFGNIATTDSATVAGGNSNTAGGGMASVGGGANNVAAGFGATVPGGFNNVAQGDLSFAAGASAQANHLGSFVWNSNGETPLSTTGDGQFLVKASGGVGINTNVPAPYALRVAGDAGIEGLLDMGASGGPKPIVNLADPLKPQDAATKQYVDTRTTASAFLLPDYITGCELEWVDTSKIRVLPGAIELNGALLKNGLASPDLDTNQPGNWLHGSAGPNQWGYVYLGAGAPDWIVKLSDEPPDSNDTQRHPGGTLRYRNYAGTWYRCVGAVRYDGSGNILKFYQREKTIMYDIPLLVTSTPSVNSWSGPVSCSSAMPPFSTLAIFGLSTVSPTDFAAIIWIKPNGSTGHVSAENGIGVWPTIGTAGDSQISGQRWCCTDSLQQIQHQERNVHSDPMNANIDVEGYQMDLR